MAGIHPNQIKKRKTNDETGIDGTLKQKCDCYSYDRPVYSLNIALLPCVSIGRFLWRNWAHDSIEQGSRIVE